MQTATDAIFLIFIIVISLFIGFMIGTNVSIDRTPESCSIELQWDDVNASY